MSGKATTQSLSHDINMYTFSEIQKTKSKPHINQGVLSDKSFRPLSFSDERKDVFKVVRESKNVPHFFPASSDLPKPLPDLSVERQNRKNIHVLKERDSTVHESKVFTSFNFNENFRNHDHGKGPANFGINTRR